MSDDQDKSQQTEDPTPRRLEEAFSKGNVPKSQEVNHWFMLAGSGLAVALFAGQVATGLRPLFVQFLQLPHEIPVDAGNLLALFRQIGFGVLQLLLLPGILLVVAALAGNMVQHKPALSAERMKPDLKKLSPMKGLQKMFGLRGAIELAKSLLKIAVIGAIAVAVVWPSLRDLQLYAGMDLLQLVQLIRDETMHLLIAVVVVLTVIAGADFAYQRYEWFRNLKMSRQEVKDEFKQSEGDPQIKSRIRQIRMERARVRIAQAVPTADVVVTNPTHFAVALKYDAASMAAPKLIAKGQDNLAMRIRELATQHDVPIVENPPLARGLYKSVELDQEVPPQFYKAVAEVIGYVMRLKGKLPQRQGPRPTARLRRS